MPEETDNPPKILTLQEWLAMEPDIDLEEDEMILYHGTTQPFSNFKTPTGKEKMVVTSGGVVYLYQDIERAQTYKDPNYVCVSKVTHPVHYAEQRTQQGLKKKKGVFTRGVWVALPSNIEIIGFIPTSELKTP